MLIVAKEYQKAMKDGTQDVTELAEYLMKTQSVYELAMSLAELMIDVESSTPKKIVVTEAEMKTIMSIFRIRGYDENGEKILSGRKKKEKGA